MRPGIHRIPLAAAATWLLWLVAACTPAPVPAPPPAPSPAPPAPAPIRTDTAVRRDTVVARPAPRKARADSLADAVRICAGGDVTMGTNLDTAWAVRATRRDGRRVRALPSPDSLVAPLRTLLGDADIALVNVEGAIGDEPTRFSKCRPGSTNCYAFRQPAAAADALRSLRPDSAAVVGNVANNHARDAGSPGLDTTVARLISAGVFVTGTDTLATPAWTASGDTVAFLGFSTSGGPDPRDLAGVRRHVARAAERWPRLVVTMHMGAEGAGAQRARDTTEMFLGLDRGNVVAFARTAAESGADLVVGHGPHVMRAVAWLGDVLAAYSLGNLLTYGPFTLSEPMNRAGLLCATLGPDGRVRAAELRTTRQRSPGFVSADSSGRAAVLADSLGRRDFPFTAARITREGRILPPAPHHP